MVVQGPTAAMVVSSLSMALGCGLVHCLHKANALEFGKIRLQFAKVSCLQAATHSWLDSIALYVPSLSIAISDGHAGRPGMFQACYNIVFYIFWVCFIHG